MTTSGTWPNITITNGPLDATFEKLETTERGQVFVFTVETNQAAYVSSGTLKIATDNQDQNNFIRTEYSEVNLDCEYEQIVRFPVMQFWLPNNLDTESSIKWAAETWLNGFTELLMTEGKWPDKA